MKEKEIKQLNTKPTTWAELGSSILGAGGNRTRLAPRNQGFFRQSSDTFWVSGENETLVKDSHISNNIVADMMKPRDKKTPKLTR